MKYIRDLSEADVQLIIKALENDGFSKVRLDSSNDFISFSKSPRNFELYSLNIFGDYNEDTGLNIYLDEDKLFSDLTRSDRNMELVNFSKDQKVRHSTSMSQREEHDAVSAADSIPGWSTKEIHPIDDSSVYVSRPTISSILLKVNIKGKEHFILDNGPNKDYTVYEGSPDVLIGLMKDSPENFFDAPSLIQVLNDLKLKMDDL